MGENVLKNNPEEEESVLIPTRSFPVAKHNKLRPMRAFQNFNTAPPVNANKMFSYKENKEVKPLKINIRRKKDYRLHNECSASRFK